MTVIEPGGASGSAPSIVARAQGLLTQSAAEWRKIEPEPATAQSLFIGYLIPLALIPAIATLIGLSVFGAGVPGIASVKLPILSALTMAALSFVMTLVMTWVMGLVINALAGNFAGTQNPTQALKVAVYSGTGVLLAGVFQAYPPLGILGLVGLIFSIFLLHSGLPVLMKAPSDRATGYTVSVVLVMLVLWIVVGVAASAVTGPITRAAMFGGAGVGNNGTVKIGDATIDMGALQKAAKDMEAASVAAAQGGSVGVTGSGAAVDLERLKAMLPETLPGGFARTEISTGSSGAAGVGVGSAQATYTSGERTIDLTLADLGAMGAIAGMAGAMNVQTSTENADGFERARTIDGRLVTEELSRSAKTAKYGVVVANRFMLGAEGRNVGIDDVKGAVDAVGVARVEALAK